MFFPFVILTSKCSHKGNTTSQIPKVVSACNPVLRPAEKFISSQFSSYSFASRSKHHKRHKPAVQVVRKSLLKISQALLHNFLPPLTLFRTTSSACLGALLQRNVLVFLLQPLVDCWRLSSDLGQQQTLVVSGPRPIKSRGEVTAKGILLC